MGFNKYNFKESYLNSYIQNAKDKPYAIAGGISFVLAIPATLNKIFNWVGDDVVNNILLIIPIASFAIITILCVPYMIWKSQQKEIADLRSAVKRTNKLSDRERKDIARVRDIQVLEIPSTLIALYQQMQKVARDQISKGIDKQATIQIVLELLDIYEVDTTTIIDDQGNLASVNEKILKKKLNRILKRTMKAFTFKPSDKEKIIKLFSYIEGALKKRNMGIEQYCIHDKRYSSLMTRLNHQRERANPNLSNAIDEVLLFSTGHSNMLFLTLYTEFDIHTLRTLRTLKLRKFTSALSMLDRPFKMLVNGLIANVSKCADEYVAGIG